MNIRFLAPAPKELDDAVREYETKRPGLGMDFRDAAKAVLRRVADFPDAWHSLGGEFRRASLAKFPYAIGYAHESSQIIVLAIAHRRREPNCWYSRR